jgi:hypothetical protein
MRRMMIILCQWDLKIGKIFTPYQRELFKKIPCLGTFCTQSVNLELSRNFLVLSSGRSYMVPPWEPKIPRILITYRLKTFFFNQSLSDDFTFRYSLSIAIGYFTWSYPSPRFLWARGSNVDVTVIGLAWRVESIFEKSWIWKIVETAREDRHTPSFCCV